MFDIKDKDGLISPIAFRCLSTFSQVLEGLVLVELGHLKGSRVLPLGVTIMLVKFNGMVVVAWNLVTTCTMGLCNKTGAWLG